MQVVIDDEKIIELLEYEWGYEGIREDVRRLFIENGIPLPKGHGRLIDADAFQKYCFNKNFERRLSDAGLFFINLFLSDAPTIIEADKESEE